MDIYEKMLHNYKQKSKLSITIVLINMNVVISVMIYELSLPLLSKLPNNNANEHQMATQTRTCVMEKNA